MTENLQRLECGAFEFPSLGNLWGVEVNGAAVEVSPVADYLARGLAAVRRGQPFAWALVCVRATMDEAQAAKRILVRERKAIHERGVQGMVGGVCEKSAESAGADGVAAGHVHGGGVGDVAGGEPACPNCGARVCVVVAAGPESDREQVQCLNCGLRGPTVPRVFNGRETAWQAFARVMVHHA